MSNQQPGRLIRRATSAKRRTATGSLLWSDAPASAVGTTVNASGGTLTNWDSTSWNFEAANSECAVVSDATKGKALQFTLPANTSTGGLQRAEQVPSYKPIINQITWIGWDWWIDTTVANSTSWSTILQIKPVPEDPSSGSPRIELDYKAHNYTGLVVIGGSNATSYTYTSLGNVSQGAWHRLVLGVNLRKDNQSWANIWLDGTEIYAQGNPAPTSPDGLIYSGASSAYYKLGNYRGAPRTWQNRFLYANLKIGTTREIVS